MTRDSNVWWVGMVGAIIAALATNFNVIDPLIPAAHVAQVHAALNLLAMVIGVVSGKMATSPLAHSGDQP